MNNVVKRSAQAECAKKAFELKHAQPPSSVTRANPCSTLENGDDISLSQSFLTVCGSEPLEPPRPVVTKFPGTGFVRIDEVLAPAGPICVSRSGWWAGIKAGRFPKPVKLSPRVTAWRVEDILELIEAARYVE